MFSLGFKVVALGLVVALPFQALADGGRLLGRSRAVCPPTFCPPAVVAAPAVHTAVPVVTAPIVSHAGQLAVPFSSHSFALPYTPVQQQPLVIQNNYPAPPVAIGSSVYGYSVQQSGSLNYGSLQPGPYAAAYQVDPNVTLQQATTLAQESQRLTQQATDTFERLSTRILTQQAETQQLMARAALIQATAPLMAGQQAQAYSASTQQSIQITPDGQGGFHVQLVGGGPVQQPAPAVPSAAPQAAPEMPADPPQANLPVHPGILVLRDRCAACHTGVTAKGGFTLFASETQLNAITQEMADSMLAAISSQEPGTMMPPATKPDGQPIPRLTEGELLALQSYLSGGSVLPK